MTTNSFGKEASKDDYFNLSLQELANLSVISGISRKEQSNFHSTSASYVITQEAIKRSGMMTIPDLLRMVPGMHVSQLNGNMWAINTRSPNNRFSDELLVMIDGRSVFNTLFNGVYWSRVDTMLEDIERIEVIRGPGSSLWGSNASNGIVNIVTKTADKTQGLLFNVSAGTEQFDNEESLRLGFSGEHHDSRVYVKRTRLVPSTYPPHDEQARDVFEPGKTDYDGRKWSQAGFRSDLFLSSRQSLTVQGDYYKGYEDEMRVPELKNTIDVTGHNVLARYQHELENNSTAVLQVYVDYTESEDDFFKDIRETYDIDFSHNFMLTRQQFLWGMSYRQVNNRTDHYGNVGRFALSPEKRTDETSTFFIQDEISLVEDILFLTIGSKFENNDYTDQESQPNIKLAYHYNEDVFFWGSLSKAISIPSRTQSDAYLDFNAFNNFCSPAFGLTNDPELGCIIPIGSTDLEANTLYAKELGYRHKFDNNITIDNTLFMHDYRQNPGGNHRTDYIWGYEGVINYKVNSDWALEASWTYHRGKDSITEKEIEDVPRNSGFLSSYYTLRDNIDLDLSYYYTSHTDTHERIQRVDLRLGYRPTKTIELSLIGSNLFDSKHTEGKSESTRANTNIKRAVIGKISYKFN
ncbi:MAG: TonB-dependent receptor [Gammaproteobacteria bacterium]|nr:TonB-dependent receptor [Gammaproteobacteria bacterium]